MDLEGPDSRRVPSLQGSLLAGCWTFETENKMTDENRNKRHPAIEDIMQFFVAGHLPSPFQQVSGDICTLAAKMADTLEGPELTAGLRKLLEAKDCFVRAKVAMLKKEPGEKMDTDAMRGR